jgi:hypothetical protein
MTVDQDELTGADAAEIKRRAERRIGEIIEDQRKAGKLAKPPGGSKTRPKKDRVSKKPDLSLADQGVDKNLADRARKAAAMPAREFEADVAKLRSRAVAAAEGNKAVITDGLAQLSIRTSLK